MAMKRHLQPHYPISKISINIISVDPRRRGAVVKGVEHISSNFLVNIWVARVRVPAGSVGLDLNLQKLNYQYLTTSVAVVLVVRW